MMQYLVILLDDTSVAYCHATNPLKTQNLIPLEVLRRAIHFGMKENLMIQYVYPDYDLPEEYNSVIDSIDHIKIGREIVVYNTVPDNTHEENIVLRLSIDEFIQNQHNITNILPKVKRLNISFINIEAFSDKQIEEYKQALTTLSTELLNLYKIGKQPQVNILTDRIWLTEMHNCGAGITNITVAPNGKFYICPAFYYDERMGKSNRLNYHKQSSDQSVGDLDDGLKIPNKHLLKLNYAPLCRLCDAFHCNRCIWLNQKLTWENNTPSHQQCVLSHIERNASRDLQKKMNESGFNVGGEIKEITYLDPFDVREEF